MIQFIASLISISLLILTMSVSVIPYGHIGIESFFGSITESPLLPGFHFRNPLSWVTKVDVRTQKADETGVIPSKEMLNMTLKTSINYHLDTQLVVNLYKSVGDEYFEKLVEPHIRSSIRQVTSEYKAEQLFSRERNEIANKIQSLLESSLSHRGIVIESVMLKEITPPDSLQKAIELKQTHQQEAEGMEFKLEREKLEAERKKIEAKGIQEFQEIVKQGIDKNLLTWKGIEATEQLVKSPNSKVIIIGNKDTGGLPLIIGGN